MSTHCIRVIRTREELSTLAADWNDLVSRSYGACVFLTWEWISTWVDVYLRGDELFVIAVYSDAELVAIAPWYRSEVRTAGLVRARVLRFLGSGETCSDYLDIIASQKNHARWLLEIWNRLCGPLSSEWDILEYSDTPSNSRSFALFYRWADEDDRCLARRIRDTSVCPFMPLAESVESFHAGLSGTRRYSINRSRRRLDDNGRLEFHFLTNADDLDVEFERLRELNTHLWNSRGQPGSFASPGMVKFHREVARAMLKAERLLFCSLWSDLAYLGAFYGYIFDGVLYYYVMSVGKSELKAVNTGDVLLAACMEEGIRRGCREFDFLRGDEPYKYRWTDRVHRNVTVHLYNRRIRAAFALVSDSCYNALKYAAKGFLGFGNRGRTASAPMADAD